MDILANLGTLSTAQAQQMMEMQTTQGVVQQLVPTAAPEKQHIGPAVTVDLSPAAQAALNARAAAASPTNDDSGGLSFDDGGTGYDDGGYEAQQESTAVDPQ